CNTIIVENVHESGLFCAMLYMLVGVRTRSRYVTVNKWLKLNNNNNNKFELLQEQAINVQPQMEKSPNVHAFLNAMSLKMHHLHEHLKYVILLPRVIYVIYFHKN
ncbi:hypothetical protein ILUMI_10301, partial [Ignelater luminosus]